MKNLITKDDLVTDVTVRDIEMLDVETDATSYARLGWIIVIFGVIGFLTWASFAPLDKGVPLSGNIAVASSRKIVQHQTGGTIDQILTKDGDEVKAGQVLIKMNDVNVRSSAEIARVQWYAAKATEARLLAERDGANAIQFPPVLIEAKKDPRIAANLSSQEQLFATRRSGLQSDLGAIKENIEGLKLQAGGLEESMVNKKQQQEILKEQVTNMRDLAKEGYVARNRLLDLERTYAQVNGSISEDIGNFGRVKRQIAELTFRQSQRMQDAQKEVRTQLADVQKEADSLQSRLEALDFDLKNSLVRAPVDGTIVGLNVFTNGAVVAGGFKLLEIVPKDDALIVEAVLAVNLVDKVHQGLKVEMIFSAFNTNTTPHIPGIITGVSADRAIDERNGQAYYKVRAAVAPEGMKEVAKLAVRPGMPVELLVKTGERTMMNYLLKPVFDRAKTSLTEE
jgi:membrane fusion protein, protease secretion system